MLWLNLFSTLIAAGPTFDAPENQVQSIWVTGSSRTVPPTTVEMDGIALIDLSVDPDYGEWLKRFLNEPASPQLLEQIKVESAAYFREKGFPFVSTLASYRADQQLLVLLVVIAKVGQIRAEGARWSSNELALQSLSLQQGDYIQEDSLIADNAWLNHNPFQKRRFIYEKGQNFGETDIVVVTEDRFPIQVFGFYENTGNIIAGNSRYTTGLTFGNLFGLGHQITYQFVTASQTGSLHSNLLNYVMPFPWRHTAKFIATYVKVESHLGSSTEGTVAPTTQRGKGWQLSGRYSIPCPVIDQLRHDVAFGFDFKRTNNFLSYSPELVFENYFDIDQFILSYEGLVTPSFGTLTYSIEGFFSPGSMTDFNRDSDYTLERPGAKASYIYVVPTLDFVLRLPYDFSWSLFTKGQFSSGKLLPTEELTLGGYLTVRGYEENEIICDTGLLTKTEFRLPPFKLLYGKDVADEFQLLIFSDFGYASEVDPNIYNQSDARLLSVGTGARYRISDYVNIHADYGYQIRPISRNDRPFTDNDRSRFHFGAMLSF